MFSIPAPSRSPTQLAHTETAQTLPPALCQSIRRCCFSSAIGTDAAKDALSATQALFLVIGAGASAEDAAKRSVDAATIAGSFTGAANANQGIALRTLPTNATLPLTTAWGQINDAIGFAQTADISTPVTVGVTLSAIGSTTPAFVAGGVVTVAGVNFCEQAPITWVETAPFATAGVQKVTLSVRNPNGQGSYLFQGGIAGQYISCDANMHLAQQLSTISADTYFGMRTTYYAFGCIDGSTLYYGHYIAGARQGNIGEGKNEACNPQVPVLAGFHLYPGAEVVANHSPNANPQLEPNSVNWQVGDVVENPHGANVGGDSLWVKKKQNSPTAAQFESGSFINSFFGTGITGSYTPFAILNQSVPQQYENLTLPDGTPGPLSAPTAVSIGGPFRTIFDVPGPIGGGGMYNSVINVGSSTTAQTPFNLWSLPVNGQRGGIQVAYFPATGRVVYPRLAAGTGDATIYTTLHVQDTAPTFTLSKNGDGGYLGYVQTFGDYPSQAAQFGIYFNGDYQNGVVPAASKKSMFAFDIHGNVGSTINLFATGTEANNQPIYRNLLDDGSGNASIAGVLTAKTGVKLAHAALVTPPQDGLLEFDGTHLYFTIGTTRSVIV